MFKKQRQLWLGALHEALACIGLALRDMRHAGLWWRSSLSCIAAVGLWGWLYHYFASFFLRVSFWTTLFALLGAGGMGMFAAPRGQVPPPPATLSNIPSFQGTGGLLHSLLSMAQVALVVLAALAVVYALLFIFATLCTATASMRWLCLERIREVAARRYPAWTVPEVPADRPRSLVRQALALLALLIPVWSAVVLLRVLLTLNVRLMYGPAGEGVLDADRRRALAAAQRPATFVMGLLLFAMMLVPVLNLLVPGLVCSSVCHLQRRGWTGTTDPVGTAQPTGPGLAAEPVA